MPEIGMSGSMSGDGKRSVGHKPQVTAPILDSTMQRYYKKEWAENCMMQMMVDNLDAWWEHIAALDLPKVFGVQPPKAPAMQPRGLRVGYVYDPSGVLWHVAERRENAPAD